MHIFLVLGVVVGVALAGSNQGYNYKVPQNSNGLPSLQTGSGSNNFNNGFYPGLNANQGQFVHSSGPSFPSGQTFESFGTSGLGSDFGSNFGSAGSNFGSAASNFGSAGLNFGSVPSSFGPSGSNFGSLPSNLGSLGSNFGSSGFNFGPSGSSFGLSGSNFGSSGSNFGSSDFGSTGFGSSLGNGGLGSSFFESSTIQPSYSGSQFGSSNSFQSTSQNKYQYVKQPAQIFKHFYVHAAPEEPESAKPRQPIVLPPPQKHYKIIFIKAPSQNYAPPVIPVQQQNEEKTIVYVLVKKPEDAQNIVLPKFESKPPTKPEVFFIKYNSKEGSQAVINNIVNDYNKGGASVNYNAGEQQAIVTGGNFNLGPSGFDSLGISSSVIAPTGIASTGLGDLNGFESSGTSSGSSYGVTSAPIVTVSTVDNGSSAGVDFTVGSTVSPAHSGVTGTYTETSSQSSGSFGGSNLVSTSQGVPHETYGTPKFRE